jgi:orotate phosphoribosyltransferase
MFNKNDLRLYRQGLFKLLLKDAYRKEAVVLSSGKQSSYYIDARTVTLNPEGAFYAAAIILSMLETKPEIKAIGGPTIGADPIVGSIAAVSFINKIPLKTFILRKTPKAHGKRRQIEGPDIETGSSVAIIDDVATTGSSLIDSVNILSQGGILVKEAIVIIDREEGAGESLNKLNVNFSSIFKAKDFQNPGDV